MLAFTERQATIGGLSTRVLESRPAAPAPASAPATTLLFIHGWADSADTFRPLMAALAGLDARLVAIDLPQFGAAQDLAPGPQLPQYARFVSAALAAFASPRLLPVGQSLGGRALLMALNGGSAPAVGRCVVVGPAPLELPAWQKMLVRNGSLMPSASRLGDTLTPQAQREELLRSFQRTCFAQTAGVPDSVWSDYLRHYTPARIGRHMESLRAIGAELQQPLDFSGLACHVDIVWGELDRMAPLAGAHHYQRALPQSRLTVLAGCGHHAHLERVDDCAALIRAALG